MAYEPVNIFSWKIDPQGVSQLLRGCGGEVQVTGPDDDWKQIVLRIPARFLPSGEALTFTHSAEYYDGDKWPMQVFGMRNYFADFPDVKRKPEILQAISNLRFALSVGIPDDLNIDSDDPRLEIVYAVCSHLDGLIFTPSSLRDAQGRILIDAAGGSDLDAKLPTIPPTVKFESPEESPAVDEDEPIPPTPQRVAARAMVLSAVANRGLLENEADESANGFCQYMVKWLNDLGLADEPEPNEWEVLQRPIGTLSSQQMIDSIWRIESLAMLAWALHWLEMPVYDELVSPPTLFDAVACFDLEQSKQMMASATLRVPAELEEMRRTQLAFHWRVRNYVLRPEKFDFVAFSKDCWFGSFDITPFHVIDNDLALGGLAISDADEETVSRSNSLAMERHLAINWMFAGGLYSETDTST